MYATDGDKVASVTGYRLCPVCAIVVLLLCWCLVIRSQEC